MGENATTVRWKERHGLKTQCFSHSHGAQAELDSDESLLSALAVTPAGGDLEKKFGVQVRGGSQSVAVLGGRSGAKSASELLALKARPQ